MNKRIISALIIVFFPAAIIAQESTSEVYDIVDAKLGATKNVHRIGDLWLAGQFGQTDLELIKDKGIKRIITLRTKGEIDWDEKKAVEDAGLKYVEVPFRSPESLTNEVFDKIRKLLKDKKNPTLFHCGSANRVGAVWLPFRVLDEKVNLGKAMEEAKTIGLRTQSIKRKALDYIKEQQNSND